MRNDGHFVSAAMYYDGLDGMLHVHPSVSIYCKHNYTTNMVILPYTLSIITGNADILPRGIYAELPAGIRELHILFACYLASLLFVLGLSLLSGYASTDVVDSKYIPRIDWT